MLPPQTSPATDVIKKQPNCPVVKSPYTFLPQPALTPTAPHQPTHNASLRNRTHTPPLPLPKRRPRPLHHPNPLPPLHHPLPIRHRPLHRHSPSRRIHRRQKGNPYALPHPLVKYPASPTPRTIPPSLPIPPHEKKNHPLTPPPTRLEIHKPHPRPRPPRRRPLSRAVRHALRSDHGRVGPRPRRVHRRSGARGRVRARHHRCGKGGRVRAAACKSMAPMMMRGRARRSRFRPVLAEKHADCGACGVTGGRG